MVSRTEGAGMMDSLMELFQDGGAFENLAPPEKTVVKRNKMPILEADVEAYGIREANKRGWSFEKFTSPQKRGVPDRLGATGENLFHPHGLFFFVEFKAPYQIATDSQQADHLRRRTKGHLVFVCDCYEQVDMAFDIVEKVLTTGVVSRLPQWLVV